MENKKEINYYKELFAVMIGVAFSMFTTAYHVFAIMKYVLWFNVPIIMSFKQWFGILAILSLITIGLNKSEKSDKAFSSEVFGLIFKSIFYTSTLLLIYYVTHFFI